MEGSSISHLQERASRAEQGVSQLCRPPELLRGSQKSGTKKRVFSIAEEIGRLLWDSPESLLLLEKD